MIRTRSKIQWLILFVTVVTFTGCSNENKNRIYEQNTEIADGKWFRSNKLEFRFEIKDASKQYHLFYNIRNSNLYPYSNLYVKFFLEDTLGNLILSRQQEMYLFDPTTGEPAMLAGGSMGDVFQHRYPAFHKYSFAKAGTYVLRLMQNMRDEDPLPEIMAVGLRVEKVDPVSK